MDKIDIPKEIVRLDKITNKLIVNIWPKQKMFLQSQSDELLFGGAAGGGKVACDGTFILTPFGWKKSEDIRIGDTICNPDGSHQRVILVHPEIRLPRWTVKFHDGTELPVMKEHLWLAWKSGMRKKRNQDGGSFGEGSAQVVTTEILKDWLEQASIKKRPTWPLIPVCKEQCFNFQMKYPSKLDPYILGVLLGDGHIGVKAIGITSMDTEHYKNVLSEYDYHITTRKNNKALQYSFRGDSLQFLRAELHRLDLLGKHSWEKFIPKEFLFGSVETRYAVLQGLLDTDGSVYAGRRIEYSSTSEELAKGVAHLVRSLGGVAITHTHRGRYTKNGTHTLCRQVWRLEIKHFFPEKLFKLKIKREKAKEIPKALLYKRVVEVLVGEKICGRCITVSHPNGLYITNDFIVTHNSIALLLFALQRRMENPGTLGITFRRKFPDLERALIRLSHGMFPKVGARYNETKHSWKFPNGSVHMFGFCDRDSAVYDHHGAEYHDMGFDEATHFSFFQFSYLTSRCRSAIPGVKALVRLASNPGGVGHLWCKKRYVDPGRIQNKWYLEAEKKELSFIPSLLEDNPSLHLNDPTYEHRLRILGEKKFKALRYGDWEVFEGQYFDEWDDRPGQSVLVKDRVPDSHTIKFLSMDWGYAAPAVVLWFEVTPSGRIFIYRELYTTRRSPRELAQDIAMLCPVSEEYRGLYAPPEIWGKEIEQDGGGEPIAKLMQDVLKNRLVMIKANNARVPGWMKMREYLAKAPDGLPWLQISPSCKNLVRTLPSMIHDEMRPEDLESESDDHCVDAARYGIIGLNELPKVIMQPQGVIQGFDKIFGTKEEAPKSDSAPALLGRSGYGS